MGTEDVEEEPATHTPAHKRKVVGTAYCLSMKPFFFFFFFFLTFHNFYFTLFLQSANSLGGQG